MRRSVFQSMPTCDECNREFATEEALSQHLKDKHGVASPRATKEQAGGGSRKSIRRQKSLRKRNRHPVALALVVVAVAAGLGVYFVASPYFASPPFPGSSGESWIHVHPYLTIDIAGTNVWFPGGVGIFQGWCVLDPVHTHYASGLLHVELSQSDAKSHNFTLGDFFNIWSYTVKSVGTGEGPTLNGRALPVEFSSSDILGFHANSTYQVRLLVDGKPSTQWGSLNIEQLDYCSTANSGLPCCPTDCSTGSSTASEPLCDGTANYPYGTGHTIVIEYAKV